MTYFKIYINDENELLKGDASLSYGHFEYSDNEISISFFKERSCMLFLNLAGLIDVLNNKKAKKQWFASWMGIGGRDIPMRRKGNQLMFFEKKDIQVDFELFEKSVFQSANQFFDECVLKNSEIKKETAFQDLMGSLGKI